MTVFGRADAYVDLVDPEAKGIHMSRLYHPGAAGRSKPRRRVAISALSHLQDGRNELHSGGLQGMVNIRFEGTVDGENTLGAAFGVGIV